MENNSTQTPKIPVFYIYLYKSEKKINSLPEIEPVGALVVLLGSEPVEGFSVVIKLFLSSKSTKIVSIKMLAYVIYS